MLVLASDAEVSMGVGSEGKQLQQHQRQPQREDRRHDDHAHEAYREEGLALNVGECGGGSHHPQMVRV